MTCFGCLHPHRFSTDYLRMVVMPSSFTVLAEPAWRSRQQAHESRVRAWTDPHQARTARGVKHPVYDFLFTYYTFRPAWLRRWHPGPEIALTGDSAREFLRSPEYRETPDGIVIDAAALPPHRREFVTWLRDLLCAMQNRPAFFGCYGLHEWAMVYRQTADELRHNTYPLRFPAAELARIVESSPICCTHFDAF